MPKGYGEGPPQIGKQKLYFALILNWFINQKPSNAIKYNDKNLNNRNKEKYNIEINFISIVKR